MKANFTGAYAIALLFSIIVFSVSCSKGKDTSNTPREQLVVGKWNINRVQLRIYYSGTFFKDTIIPQTPMPENFVKFVEVTKNIKSENDLEELEMILNQYVNLLNNKSILIFQTQPILIRTNRLCFFFFHHFSCIESTQMKYNNQSYIINVIYNLHFEFGKVLINYVLSLLFVLMSFIIFEFKLITKNNILK